jgi:competence protein ComEC
MSRPGWLAFGAVAGAVVAVAVGESSTALAATTLGALAAAAAAWLPRPRGRSVALVALVAGFVAVTARAAIGAALPVAPPAESPSAAGGTRHSAVVLSVGVPHGGLQRAVVELRPPEPAEHVYVWLPRYPSIAQADRIEFNARLEQPPTEGGFAEYLARSGISATARSRSLEVLGGDGSPLAALEALRRGAAELIAKVLPEPQAGLATAMAIGLRDVVARDVSDEFRTAGLSHVVAISGWHIAMIGAVTAALLRGLGRRPRSVLVVLVICLYSLLAGASPGILRAAVMASVVIVARESGRRGQASAALALTCVALLIVEPRTVADIGFELSVAATAGLLAWAGVMRDWLVRRLPERTPGWLVEALAVSLAAQAATLPLVLYHFGRLSLVAPLANLLIAPFVAPAMLVTAICFAAGAIVTLGVPAMLIAPVTLGGALLIGAMVGIGHLSAGLPYASVELPEPLNLVAAAIGAAAIAVALRRSHSGSARSPAVTEAPGKRREARGPARAPTRLVAVGGGVAMSLLLAVVVAAQPDGRLHVTVLDIGQGDAILLQGPRGGRMLVDTGPDPDRLLALLDARVPAWDRRLDLVVLTHPHEDHVAGLALLLRRYRIGDIVEPGMIGPGPGDAAYRRELAALGRTSRIVAAGDRLWLDGIRLDISWPRRGSVALRPADGGKEINNVSIVLELTFGERRMLFTGDIEQEIDPVLLASGIAQRLDGRIDLLKVAHHGSATATTDSLVAALDPRVAVISTGLGNPYGHPSPATVARLRDSGAQLFRTDLDGNVAISTNGEDLLAIAEGGRPVRPREQTPTPPPGIGFCPIPQQGAGRRQTYNRPDVDPFARRRRGRRRAAGPTCRPAAPLDGCGRDSRVPVCCHGPPRRDAGRLSGGERGAAP